MRKTDPNWNQVFNSAIRQILDSGIMQCKTKIGVFEIAFGNIMAAKETPSTVKATFDDQLTRFVKSLDGILQDVKKTSGLSRKLLTDCVKKQSSWK